MNAYYPIYIDLRKRKALVIGGGKIAERKVRSLLRHEAEVQVISPALTSGLRELVQAEKIAYKEKEFTPSDMKRVSLVICATDDSATNHLAAAEAKKRDLLLNVVDQPDLCTFIVPSVVRRGDLSVAISTGGSSPALAKSLRKKIEKLLGPEYGEFAKLLKKIRLKVQQKIPDQRRRSRVFKEIVDSKILSMIRKGRIREARHKAEEILKHYINSGDTGNK